MTSKIEHATHCSAVIGIHGKVVTALEYAECRDHIEKPEVAD